MVACPVFPPDSATICAWPTDTAAIAPAGVTVATAGAEDDHVTVPSAIGAPP